jgi:putative endonuclease
MKIYYVYILLCSDKSYYTGITNNLTKRLEDHSQGITKYTRKRLPLRLVYYEEFEYVHDAIDREKQIKGWSRKKKIALIYGSELDLRRASRTAKNYDVPL